MPAFIVVQEAELHALAGLPHSAISMYLWLHARRDRTTSIVGAPIGISWQALVEMLYVEPHRGRLGPGHASPGREAVRRIAGWLERAGLIVMRSNANQAQLVFFLPMAKKFSRARNQTDRKPTGLTDRGATEGKSTVTRQGGNAENRQTSGKKELSAAAAASASIYRVPDFAELIVPKGSTQAEVRAFGAIARKHQLTRDELQILLDELAHKRRQGAVRNGPALIDRFAEQLRAGVFYASGADHERQGGAGLSADEARFINEGGPSRE